MGDSQVTHNRLVRLERAVQQLTNTARQLRGEIEALRERTSVGQQPSTLWSVVAGGEQSATTAPP